VGIFRGRGMVVGFCVGLRRVSARAGNRRFCGLSALRAHAKAPYKTDLHRKTRRALNRPWPLGGPDRLMLTVAARMWWTSGAAGAACSNIDARFFIASRVARLCFFVSSSMSVAGGALT
jgi:hypothetical protein